MEEIDMNLVTGFWASTPLIFLYWLHLEMILVLKFYRAALFCRVR